MRSRRTVVRHPTVRHPVPAPVSHRRRNVIAGLVTLLLVPLAVTVVGQQINDRLARTTPNPRPAATAANGWEGSYQATAFTDIEPESASAADPGSADVHAPAAPGSPGTSNGPLAVTAEHVVTNVCEDAPGWSVPIGRKQLGTAPDDDGGRGLYAWALSRGGREVSGTHLKLTLQGSAEDAVVVTEIKAQILSQERVSGPAVHVIPFGECGGEEDIHFIVVNLDERPALSHPAEIVLRGERAVIQRVHGKVTPHSYQVSRRDGETFSFYACAKEFAYSWRLLIRWTTTDGKPHTTVLSDEGGKPFLTVPRPSGSPLTNSSLKGGYRTSITAAWQGAWSSGVNC